MLRNILKLSCLLFLFACTDEIVFDTGEANDLLVVDGFITDTFGPHHVKISRAASYTSVLEGGQEFAVEGASVQIEDDLDNITILNELEPGNYVTPSSFKGEVGRKYRLRFFLGNEKQFVSSDQLLTSSGPIHTLSYELVDRKVFTATGEVTKKKIKYSIDFDFADKNQFYKWDWEETYMFPTLCKIRDNITCDTSLRRIVDINVPEWCYVRDSLPENFVNLASAQEFTTTTVQDFEFEVVDLSFKFFERHSMNVLQYSVSEEIYNYWKLIDQQVNSSGSIFDPAPVQIKGNISNPDDPTEIVLGYFGAFGVSDQRVFIDATELDEEPPDIMCPQIVNFHGEGPPSYCDDCRWWANGVAEKPAYWTD